MKPVRHNEAKSILSARAIHCCTFTKEHQKIVCTGLQLQYLVVVTRHSALIATVGLEKQFCTYISIDFQIPPNRKLKRLTYKPSQSDLKEKF